MPAPRQPRSRRTTALSIRLRWLSLGLLACAAVGLKRRGLFCFVSGPFGRPTGHSAGRTATTSKKLGRVALNEAMEYRNMRVLSLSSQAPTKLRLLQYLLTGSGKEMEVRRLITQLQEEHRSGAQEARSIPDGAWYMLSSNLLDSRIPAPQLSFFTGGQFLHEGSIQNGGLFKTIAQREAAEVKFGMPSVRISDGRMEVAVKVEVAPGQEKSLSYAVELRALSAKTLHRKLVSFELPEPLGSLRPVIDAEDLLQVTYSDDDMLILRDEAAHSEILLRESAMVWALHSKSGDFTVSSELSEVPTLALSH